MSPDDRLDQLEPLMADSLQKTDRLIEGQGQILEVATRADHKADMLDQKVDVLDQKFDSIAKGLAKLTVTTQRQYEELKAGQEAIMQYLREKLP